MHTMVYMTEKEKSMSITRVKSFTVHWNLLPQGISFISSVIQQGLRPMKLSAVPKAGWEKRITIFYGITVLILQRGAGQEYHGNNERKENKNGRKNGKNFER